MAVWQERGKKPQDILYKAEVLKKVAFIVGRDWKSHYRQDLKQKPSAVIRSVNLSQSQATDEQQVRSLRRTPALYLAHCY